MNIHLQQAEKKLPVFFYILIALAIFTVLMSGLDAARIVDFHLSLPSSVIKPSPYSASNNVPVAVPAPMPPAAQVATGAVAVPSSTPSPVPQAVAVPVPALP